MSSEVQVLCKRKTRNGNGVSSSRGKSDLYRLGQMQHVIRSPSSMGQAGLLIIENEAKRELENPSEAGWCLDS